MRLNDLWDPQRTFLQFFQKDPRSIGSALASSSMLRYVCQVHGRSGLSGSQTFIDLVPVTPASHYTKPRSCLSSTNLAAQKAITYSHLHAGNPKDSPTSLADTTARLSLDTARESSSCDSTLSRSMSWVGRGRPSQGTAKMPTDRAEESRSPQEHLSQSSAATEGPATPEKKAVQPSASLSPPENGLKPQASESEAGASALLAGFELLSGLLSAPCRSQAGVAGMASLLPS